MLFVSLEGGEGTGKTTQAKLLKEFIEVELKHSAVLTKEPGSPHVKECQLIRELLLNPLNELNERAELFLFLADRAQHVSKFVKPALEKSDYVVMDRYIDSTFVYQSIARGLDSTWVKALINYACHDLKPTLTFVLDLPTEVALKRAKSHNTEFVDGDRMERETLAFHQKIRQGFLDLIKTDKRFCLINIENKTKEEVHEEIKTKFKQKLIELYGEKYNEVIE